MDIKLKLFEGSVVQPGTNYCRKEHMAEDHDVVGSNPTAPTFSIKLNLYIPKFLFSVDG